MVAGRRRLFVHERFLCMAVGIDGVVEAGRCRVCGSQGIEEDEGMQGRHAGIGLALCEYFHRPDRQVSKTCQMCRCALLL